MESPPRQDSRWLVHLVKRYYGTCPLSAIVFKIPNRLKKNLGSHPFFGKGPNEVINLHCYKI